MAFERLRANENGQENLAVATIAVILMLNGVLGFFGHVFDFVGTRCGSVGSGTCGSAYSIRRCTGRFSSGTCGSAYSIRRCTGSFGSGSARSFGSGTSSSTSGFGSGASSLFGRISSCTGGLGSLIHGGRGGLFSFFAGGECECGKQCDEKFGLHRSSLI